MIKLEKNEILKKKNIECMQISINYAEFKRCRLFTIKMNKLRIFKIKLTQQIKKLANKY